MRRPSARLYALMPSSGRVSCVSASTGSTPTLQTGARHVEGFERFLTFSLAFRPDVAGDRADAAVHRLCLPSSPWMPRPVRWPSVTLGSAPARASRCVRRSRTSRIPGRALFGGLWMEPPVSSSCRIASACDRRRAETDGGGEDSLRGNYSDSSKGRWCSGLLLPNGPSACALAREPQVSQATLSRWLEASVRRRRVNDNEGARSRSRRPEDWSAEERLRAVTEAGRLAGEELGQFLRREGLHEETLEEWREAALDALQPSRPRGRGSDKKRLAKLEKELARKDKALAAANAVVDLQKKVHAILAARTKA